MTSRSELKVILAVCIVADGVVSRRSSSSLLLMTTRFCERTPEMSRFHLQT